MTGSTTAFVADGRSVEAGPEEAGLVLAPYLRDVLGITSIKVGCEEGSCGACTALVDGRAVPTCLVHLGRLDGATICTAATVVDTELGVAIAAAIVEGAGLQCGFCTPGVVCEAYGLLAGEATVPLSEADVRRALAGHLCRCTGYTGFVSAVAHVAAAQHDAAGHPAAAAEYAAAAEPVAAAGHAAAAGHHAVAEEDQAPIRVGVGGGT